MPEPDRDPITEVLRYALVASGMCIVMLLLSRGKWLMALIIGVWLLLAFLRFKRKH